eukprot:m.250644 g.250644  ORF g.250644 m.250644 type:complete len:684 (-) comp54508_c0_seq2:212-2263(-)
MEPFAAYFLWLLSVLLLSFCCRSERMGIARDLWDHVHVGRACASSLSLVLATLLATVVFNAVARHRVGDEYMDVDSVDIKYSCVDLFLIMYCKSGLLLLLHFLAQSIGVWLRRGRDGLSATHASVTRIVIVAVPLIAVIYVIVKAAIMHFSEAVEGNHLAVAAVATLGFMTGLELLVCFLIFGRVTHEGPDLSYLQNIAIEEDDEDEASALTDQTPLLSKPRPATVFVQPVITHVTTTVPAAQSAPRHVETETVETLEERNARHRKTIVTELLTTEQTYVRTLQMMVEVFYQPLLEAATANDGSNSAAPNVVITRDQVRAIFLQLEPLYLMNREFLKELQDRVDRWSETQSLSDLFKRYLPHMKQYSLYANNFNKALQMIDACSAAQPTVRDFLRRCVKERHECGRLGLADHMITPIQRIPRYGLLIEQLVKKTMQSHPDLAGLQQVGENIHALASEINQSQAAQSRSEQMVEIMRKVKHCPSFILPTRVFIAEFDLTFMLAREQITKLTKDTSSSSLDLSLQNEDLKSAMQTQTRNTFAATDFVSAGGITVFLFNDLLLVATHRTLTSVLDRTSESFKRALASTKVVRPVTKDSQGNDVVHKYKFLCMDALDAAQLTNVLDSETLAHGVVLEICNSVMFLKCPSIKEKDRLIKLIAEAKVAQEQVRPNSMNLSDSARSSIAV